MGNDADNYHNVGFHLLAFLSIASIPVPIAANSFQCVDY